MEKKIFVRIAGNPFSVPPDRPVQEKKIFNPQCIRAGGFGWGVLVATRFSAPSARVEVSIQYPRRIIHSIKKGKKHAICPCVHAISLHHVYSFEYFEVKGFFDMDIIGHCIDTSTRRRVGDVERRGCFQDVGFDGDDGGSVNS